MSTRQSKLKKLFAGLYEDALRQLVEESRQMGGQASYVVADVGQEEDVNRIAETAIAEFAASVVQSY